MDHLLTQCLLSLWWSFSSAQWFWPDAEQSPRFIISLFADGQHVCISLSLSLSLIFHFTLEQASEMKQTAATGDYNFSIIWRGGCISGTGFSVTRRRRDKRLAWLSLATHGIKGPGEEILSGDSTHCNETPAQEHKRTRTGGLIRMEESTSSLALGGRRDLPVLNSLMTFNLCRGWTLIFPLVTDVALFMRGIKNWNNREKTNFTLWKTI